MHKTTLESIRLVSHLLYRPDRLRPMFDTQGANPLSVGYRRLGPISDARELLSPKLN